jgi:hypothetical protein
LDPLVKLADEALCFVPSCGLAKAKEDTFGWGFECGRRFIDELDLKEGTAGLSGWHKMETATYVFGVSHG